MTERAKTTVIHRLSTAGYSSSYGALVYTVALLGTNPGQLELASDEEQHEWLGYRKGLRAALACLAMHEKGLDPATVATTVGQHLFEAHLDLWLRPGTSE